MSGIKTRFDAVAARKYTTRNGEEKTQWLNIGRAVEWDDGGLEVELNSLPCFPGWNGKIKLFVQKDRQQGQQSAPRQQQRQDPAADFQDDSIPF